MEYGCFSPPIEKINNIIDKFTKTPKTPSKL